jgi:hypothetical protein
MVASSKSWRERDFFCGPGRTVFPRSDFHIRSLPPGPPLMHRITLDTTPCLRHWTVRHMLGHASTTASTDLAASHWVVQQRPQTYAHMHKRAPFKHTHGWGNGGKLLLIASYIAESGSWSTGKAEEQVRPWRGLENT